MSYCSGIRVGVAANVTGGGKKPVSPQVAQFLARVQTQSPAYQAAEAALINGLIADGLYSHGDVCHLIRCHDPITARTNIFSSSYPAAEVSSPTFTVDGGYTGAAAKYLNVPAFNASTVSGTNFSLNSLSIGAWLTNAGAATLIGLCGFGNNSSGHPYINPTASGTTFWNDGADLSLAAPSPLTGSWLLSRTASNVLALYHNGALIASGSTASSSLFNAVARFLDDGYNDFASGCVLGPTWLGGGLTAGQALSLHNRISAFMTAAPTAVSAAYDFYDDFSGPDMQMSLNRYPVFGNNAWTLSGAAIVADPTTVRAGAGKYYHTASNGNSYAIMQLSGTPAHISGVFESSGGAWSPTIACIKDYANHGLSVMFHANLNQGSGQFSPGIWNDTWNGSPSTIVNQGPTSQVQDHNFTLVANTRYREDVYISGNTVTQTLTDMSGTVLATCISTDTLVPSVIGPWVFFELGDTSTIWHEAWAK